MYPCNVCVKVQYKIYKYVILLFFLSKKLWVYIQLLYTDGLMYINMFNICDTVVKAILS